MSAVDTSLSAAIDELLPDELPELVSPEWVANVFLLRDKGSVLHAIRTGKLPAVTVVGGGKRAATYAIRPRDAACIWGHRLVTASTAAKTD